MAARGFISWWANRHYCNPFRHTTGLQVGRVDMGVDYHGSGPICALGRLRVVAIGGQGWPGGVYIHARLLRGRHKGRHIYLAEGIKPTVRAGQLVRKGRRLAVFTAEGGPGHTGIETGWASTTTNLTLAATTEQPLPPDNADTRAGRAFARFLHNVGAPAPPVPVPLGPEYPV